MRGNLRAEKKDGRDICLFFREREEETCAVLAAARKKILSRKCPENDAERGELSLGESKKEREKEREGEKERERENGERE